MSERLTLALHATSIDAGATDHDIVDNRKAAFAANPVSLAVPQAAVGQDGGLVQPHSSTMFDFGKRQFLRVEELPY